MVGWHHQLDGPEFEQVPRIGDGQGSLVCCCPWGGKDSDTTEQLNLTELNVCNGSFLHCLTWRNPILRKPKNMN